MADSDQRLVKVRDSSLGSLLAIVSNMTRDRIELLLLELEDVKRLYFSLIVWTAAAILSGTGAVLLTNLIIIFLTPVELRPFVAVGLLVLNWLLVAWAVVRARAILRETGKPFEMTLEQLRKDAECLEDHD